MMNEKQAKQIEQHKKRWKEHPEECPAEINSMEIEFGNFLTILFIEIVSCLPDFLIHRMEIKEKNKKKVKRS